MITVTREELEFLFSRMDEPPCIGVDGLLDGKETFTISKKNLKALMKKHNISDIKDLEFSYWHNEEVDLQGECIADELFKLAFGILEGDKESGETEMYSIAFKKGINRSKVDDFIDKQCEIFDSFGDNEDLDVIIKYYTDLVMKFRKNKKLLTKKILLDFIQKEIIEGRSWNVDEVKSSYEDMLEELYSE